VREAVFSALDARGSIAGSRVLDLYAGSGAFGLEAASRGATAVTLVENNAASASIVRLNAQTVLVSAPHPSPMIVVHAQTVQSFLASPTSEFDVVYLDPPYELDDVNLAEDLRLLVPHLSVNSLVLVERSTRSLEPHWPPSLTFERKKIYGDTTVFTAALRP